MQSAVSALICILSIFVGVNGEDGKKIDDHDNDVFVREKEEKWLEMYREDVEEWKIDDDGVVKYDQKVCCEDNSKQVVCFSNGDESPWKHHSNLPFCANQIKMRFGLFSSANQQEQFIDYREINQLIPKLILPANPRLAVIIHGFQTFKWGKESWMFEMKDALLDLKYSVLLVDWRGGSNYGALSYGQAAANTRSVAAAIAEFLRALEAHKKITLSSVTLIGFSLGAQIAGQVGTRFNGSLPRIMALDPAGPLFIGRHEETRLDKTDAKFVQVLHTNGGSLLKLKFGTPETVGHVDFFPNGGKHQAGCDRLSACSHSRATRLFIAMLRLQLARQSNSRKVADHCSFKAFPCGSSKRWKKGECFYCIRELGGCLEPGFNLFDENLRNLTHSRQFYFNTLVDSESNFCGRQLQVVFTSSEVIYGEIKMSFVFKGRHATSFQTFKGYLAEEPNKESSAIFTVPWQNHDLSYINITYMADYSLTEDTSYFAITTISIRDSAGKGRYNPFETVIVKHGEYSTVQLV